MCSQCSPLFCRFAKFGTGEGLLLYRMDARYRRRAPMVRDASEAFGAKNRLLRYGREIRCKKQAFLVRDRSLGAKKGFLGYAMRFQGPPVHENPLLPHRTHLQCAERPPATSNALSEALKTASARRRANIKRGRILRHCQGIHPLLDICMSLRYGQSDRKGDYHHEQQHADPDGR